jgi:hypothetical protein
METAGGSTPTEPTPEANSVEAAGGGVGGSATRERKGIAIKRTQELLTHSEPDKV